MTHVVFAKTHSPFKLQIWHERLSRAMAQQNTFPTVLLILSSVINYN